MLATTSASSTAGGPVSTTATVILSISWAPAPDVGAYHLPAVYWADAPTGPWQDGGSVSGNASAGWRLTIPPHPAPGEVYAYVQTDCSPGLPPGGPRLPSDAGVFFAYQVQ